MKSINLFFSKNEKVRILRILRKTQSILLWSLLQEAQRAFALTLSFTQGSYIQLVDLRRTNPRFQLATDHD